MKSRPNILLIMADQFRKASLTGQGDGIETPNLDRLLAQGTLFPNAACTSPLCVPSRASLATGKYPHRCGVVTADDNLPRDQVTYYQLLRKAGYRVGLVGKTDLHKAFYPYEGEDGFFVGENGDLPVIQHLGFTDACETEGKMNSAFVHMNAEGDFSPSGPYQAYLLRKDPKLLARHFLALRNYMTSGQAYFAEPSLLSWQDNMDAFIGRKSCDFLRQAKKNVPWHLLVSFVGPHNPWDPPAEALEQVKGWDLALPPADTMEGKPAWIRKRAARQSDGLTAQRLYRAKQHYAAAVRVIDRAVGDILDTLRDSGQAEDTIVIFCADHGELMGEHGLFEKKAMYEGALRIPFILHIPGKQQPPQNDSLVELMDLAPTILDLCGVPYDSTDMDAVSLQPLLKGCNKPLRELQKSELDNTYMLFDGRYKWIHSINDQDELYDLQQDPNELNNCIAEHRDVVKKFKKRHFRPNAVDARAIQKAMDLLGEGEAQ